MPARLSLFILVIIFFACSKSNKESTPAVASSENKETSQDGVIIQVQTNVDTLKGSLKAYAESKIGSSNFTINYYSPATRGRMIWGGLVAYDQVWVTGAHRATNIEFDKNININGINVASGKYAFFTIPGKDQWTIILNKNWNQHLADNYKQEEDVLRLTVVPEIVETHQERLRYQIKDKGDGTGYVTMHWDKLKVSMPFELSSNP